MVRQQCIKEMLRSRLGQFVPSETRFLLGKDWYVDHGDLRFEVLQPPNSGEKAVVEVGSEVKQFFGETFFREAVVPKALGLAGQDDDSR